MRNLIAQLNRRFLASIAVVLVVFALVEGMLLANGYTIAVRQLGQRQATHTCPSSIDDMVTVQGTIHFYLGYIPLDRTNYIPVCNYRIISEEDLQAVLIGKVTLKCNAGLTCIQDAPGPTGNIVVVAGNLPLGRYDTMFRWDVDSCQAWQNETQYAQYSNPVPHVFFRSSQFNKCVNSPIALPANQVSIPLH